MNKRHWAMFAVAALILPGVALADDKDDRRTDRIARYFAELDADGDGQVTRAEADSHRSAMFAQADEDGDGAISETEFVDAARKRIEEHLKAQFARLDGNGDGVVSEDEFGDRRGRFFDRLDANGDGVVTLDEAKAAKMHGHKSDG